MTDPTPPNDLRFPFGKNWARFLDGLTTRQIEEAEKSLVDVLGEDAFKGRRFLDIGCGSGLFSLAARRLGATVHSLDYDADSVGCAEELKRRFFEDDTLWTIEQGSALDADYLRGLGPFDIVYSWGVLHHTGDLWKAFENALIPLAPAGNLWISIYNHQGLISKHWTFVKKLYCSGLPGRLLTSIVYYPYFVVSALAAEVLGGRNPFLYFSRYKKSRGMSAWTDYRDWLGGYPFETARPDEVFRFFRDRGCRLEHLKTPVGQFGTWAGCNDFLFQRDPGEDSR